MSYIDAKRFLIITFFSVLICLIGFLSYPVYKQIQCNNVNIGDSFKTIYKPKNPYSEPYITTGTIINRDGNYFLYVTEHGDTSSINLYDEFMFCEVEIYKNQK